MKNTLRPFGRVRGLTEKKNRKKICGDRVTLCDYIYLPPPPPLAGSGTGKRTTKEGAKRYNIIILCYFVQTSTGQAAHFA